MKAQKYDVLTDGWLTDANGASKFHAKGDKVDLMPEQAEWLVLSRQVRLIEAPKTQLPAPMKPADAPPSGKAGRKD